jgi:uncharacterized protein (TIGR03437 family)
MRAGVPPARNGLPAESAIRVLSLLSLRVTPQRLCAYRRLTKFESMKTLETVFALLLVGGLAPAQQYTISTIAGIPGVQGWFGDSGPATSGQLDKPLRVTVDSKGNYYIVDYYTNVVRMVTASTGVITTIAGNGVNGWMDGADVNGCPASGNSASGASCVSEIGYARGLAVDGKGNVYIADTTNFRIRKIDPSGNATTFAGNGTRGYAGDGKAATSADLWFPAALAFDSSGNLYVADYGNSTVRKITSDGNISTVAGNGSFGYGGDGGPAAKALLAYPISMAIDSANNIYIGDVGNNNIRKITPDGNIQTLYSNITAQSLAVDSAGNLYFVDGTSPIVQKILPSGTILTIAGTGRPGYNQDGITATGASLDLPSGVAVDASGNVYVADTNNEIIRLLTPVPFSVGAVSNAASSVQGGVAPGEIVALFGAGIGPPSLTQFTVANGAIGNQIAGTQVLFNGIPAPLLYVSSSLIAAIVPYGVAQAPSADIVVSYQGANSAGLVAPVVSAAPGIFTASATGSGQAAAVNQDGSINSAANPAKAGSVISLYITGSGLTTPAETDGQLVNASPPPVSVLTVTAQIGGQQATVTYAGATPTQVSGLTQVNVQIPAGIQTGTAVPVAVEAGGTAAQSGVTIAVQ